MQAAHTVEQKVRLTPEASRRVADVAVIGLWHLGSVADAAWAAADRRVLCWDANDDLRSLLAGGNGPTHEPGLDDALRSAIEDGLLTVAHSGADAISRAPI